MNKSETNLKLNCETKTKVVEDLIKNSWKYCLVF